MLITKYRLNSDKISGFVLLVYNDGQLYSSTYHLKSRLKPEQWDRLKHSIPYDEKYVAGLSNIGLKVTKLNNTEKHAKDKTNTFTH